MNCRQNMDTDSGGVAAAWLGSLKKFGLPMAFHQPVPPDLPISMPRRRFENMNTASERLGFACNVPMPRGI
jgi:hypothetical protein